MTLLDEIRESNNLKAALTLAEMGFFVFPCIGKQPVLGFLWLSAATRDPEKIHKMWQSNPEAVPAINCKMSGILVIDVDIIDDLSGAVYLEIIDEGRALQCPGAHTPGKGRHLYMRNCLPPIGCGRGNLPPKATAPIDVRGAGGYVIGASANTSDHPGGGIYEPIGDISDLPSIDQFPTLKGLLTGKRAWEAQGANQGASQGADLGVGAVDLPAYSQRAPATSALDFDRMDPAYLARRQQYAAKALAGMVQEIARLKDGNRNTGFNDIKYRAGRICIAWGGMAFDQVLARLDEAILARGDIKPGDRALGRRQVQDGVNDGPQTPSGWVEDIAGNAGNVIKMPVASMEMPAAVADLWQEAPVPLFPLEVLPPAARDFVETEAGAAGFDPTGLAVGALGAMSGAIHHGFRLRMKPGRAWHEGPNIWIMLFGISSDGKTPMLDMALRPLLELEDEMRKNHAKELASFMQAVKKLKKDDEQPERPRLPPLFITNNTTPEALEEILKHQPRGILLHNDELAGWFDFNRYGGKSSARSFYLQSHDGGPYNSSRVIRGLRGYVPNLSTTNIGGMQPARFIEIRTGLDSDGLLQRFFVAILRPPSEFKEEDAPDCYQEYSGLIRYLASMSPETLIMTDEALALMRELRRKMFSLVQMNAESPGGYGSFLGKMRGAFGRLALILHLAHDKYGATVPVEAVTVERVARLVFDFFIPHAEVFYTSIMTHPIKKDIASWILTSVAKRIFPSDLTTNVKSCRNSNLVELNKRMGELIADGWVLPVDQSQVCREWRVNPRVHVLFEERAKLERERKAKIAAMFTKKSGKDEISTDDTQT